MRMERVRWRDMTCALQTPCVYAMSVRHARKTCQKNVRATRSVCTLTIAHTVVATTWVRSPETKKKSSDFVVHFHLYFSHQDVVHQFAFHRSSSVNASRFPEACASADFGDAIVWNLNLRFGLPRSTISNCERAIDASRASLGPGPRGNCDVFLILESDLLLCSCMFMLTIARLV